MKLAIGSRSSGVCVILECWIDDAQMADHTLMSSVVMALLSAAGSELAMMKNVVSNRMARMKSFGVTATVVAMRLGCACRCIGPRVCVAALCAVCKRG